MTTTKLKSDLFKYIEEIEDKEVLSALRNVLSSRRKRRKDFWNNLSATERREITKAMKDIDNGHLYSFDEVIANHKKQ